MKSIAHIVVPLFAVSFLAGACSSLGGPWQRAPEAVEVEPIHQRINVRVVPTRSGFPAFCIDGQEACYGVAREDHPKYRAAICGPATDAGTGPRIPENQSASDVAAEFTPRRFRRDRSEPPS